MLFVVFLAVQGPPGSFLGASQEFALELGFMIFFTIEARAQLFFRDQSGSDAGRVGSDGFVRRHSCQCFSPVCVCLQVLYKAVAMGVAFVDGAFLNQGWNQIDL